MEKLNYGIFDEECVNIFEFFNKGDDAKKLFDKYEFHTIPCVKMKLRVICKLVFASFIHQSNYSWRFKFKIVLEVMTIERP